ncbi:hypothetical protein [Methylobacterium sp. WL18]|uniref:hypothetical protein n=1 Tax=Methylobacterium sp. WL18 TaxID=2603897 RepID=UPI0016501A0F|nr:hypothetical protein [Methylobacterium sp. WL18]
MVHAHNPGRTGSVAAWPPAARRTETDPVMLDLIFIAAGLAFFALGEGYAVLCDRL